MCVGGGEGGGEREWEGARERMSECVNIHVAKCEWERVLTCLHV